MREKVNNIIKDMLNSRGKKSDFTFSEEVDIRKDLGLDSLDLAELTVRIEDATGIDVFADGLVFTLGEIYFKLEK